MRPRSASARDRRRARRVPSALRVFWPKPFPISPTPTAPAATSASSWAIARSAHPGPTFWKLMPVSTRTRSFIRGDSRTAATTRFSSSPGHVVRRHHQPDVDAVERRAEAGEILGRAEPVPGMAVKVDHRILRLLQDMRRDDQRRARAVVEDARRRHVRSHAVARTGLRHPRRTGLTRRDRRTAFAARLRRKRAVRPGRRPAHQSARGGSSRHRAS